MAVLARVRDLIFDAAKAAGIPASKVVDEHPAPEAQPPTAGPSS